MRSRSVIAACLLLATAACGGYTPPNAVYLRPMPQPDLCRDIKAKTIQTALGGKVTSCATDAQKYSFGARFNGTARFNGAAKDVPVALVVSYGFRYDQQTGFDQWEVFGETNATSVSVIGVGEGAVYDESKAILTVVAHNLIITVGIQAASGATVPVKNLPDHLLAVMQEALDLDTPTTPTPTPGRERPAT
jgi:hypothetical protein